MSSAFLFSLNCRRDGMISAKQKKRKKDRAQKSQEEGECGRGDRGTGR
jgi:hypothetical protein